MHVMHVLSPCITWPVMCTEKNHLGIDRLLALEQVFKHQNSQLTGDYQTYFTKKCKLRRYSGARDRTLTTECSCDVIKNSEKTGVISEKLEQ